jgi:protein TonB
MGRTGLRSHLSGSLPISIAIHLVALLAIFVVPLVANIVVPTVSVVMPEYVRVVLPPPPPVVIQQPRLSTAAPVNPVRTSNIPIQAPPDIQPEAPSPAYVPGPIEARPGINVDGALPVGPVVAVPAPPAPPKPQGPVRVADLPVPPHKTVDVRPIYPEIARAARVQGLVVMEAVLDPSGHVTQLRVIRSVPMLDQAAMDAVKQWRYTPSIYYGKPVSVLMTITINFTLQ